MSLPPREETIEDGAVQQQRGRRISELYRDNFSKSVIEARLKEAEYKESVGMELTQYDEFLLQNKHFFKKVLKKGD